MQINLSRFTDLAARDAQLFDLHEDFGVTHLVEEDDRQSLFINDEWWGVWGKRADLRSMHLKWLDRDRVILHRGHRETAILTAAAGGQFAFGPVERLYVSKSYIFVGYGDESVFGAETIDDPASQAVSAYSHEGLFKVGLRTFYERNPALDVPFGIATGYTHDDRLIFEGLVENFIRILDVERPQLDILPTALNLGWGSVVSGNSKRAYAIRDLRWPSDTRARDPFFELIAIDLVAPTATKHDHAPLEADLIDAGFDMHTIKFQQNATGRIIVTDGAKAALLEISETG